MYHILSSKSVGSSTEIKPVSILRLQLDEKFQDALAGPQNPASLLDGRSFLLGHGYTSEQIR